VLDIDLGVSNIKYKLRTKLSLSYLLITLICVASISIFANIFLEKQFREYVIKNQNVKNQEIMNMISNQYGQDNKWNYDYISNIGMNALESGIIIKVKDSKGKIIWDATKHNTGLCNQMIEQMAQNMNSRYSNWQGKYTETKYPIVQVFKQIGTLEIGYYGPFYFDDNDLKFINNLNWFLIAIAVFAFVISLFFGTLMAKRISNPISRVIKSAELIAKGYYGDCIPEKSNTREIHDLTETINNLAETFENQDKLRKRLTSDVAHELRTPLTTLQSHMEAMIDGVWEPNIERIKSCHEEILRINRMVGDLENLEKIESDNIVLDKTEFDIAELTRNIITNFESDFVKKNIKIMYESEEQLIMADKDKISQVIVNLLSNSLKYTEKGGKVKVYISGDKDKVQLIVKDTGIGIPKEDLQYIFERFYRADKSRNRLTGGSGIGLAITKAMVEAHNGSIEVQSKLNEGTEFTIKMDK